MGQAETLKQMRRFTLHIIIGAVVSGVLCLIPVFNIINFFFCIMNMGGVVFALWLYLKSHPDDTPTTSESLAFGALTGAGAGLFVLIVSSLITMIQFRSLSGILGTISGFNLIPWYSPAYTLGFAAALFTPLWIIILYSAFGLLGSFLGTRFFLKTRIRSN